MKNLYYLVFVILIAFSSPTLSQDFKATLNENIDKVGDALKEITSPPLNLGLRFSNGYEISYQKPLNDSKRLEINLGYCPNNRKKDFDMCLNGSYQWQYPLSDLEEISWYTGLVLTTYYNDLKSSPNFNFGLGGIIGIEYISEMPLHFFIDFRPAYFVLQGGEIDYNIGFGARYLIR